ncbi:MAG: alpha/beta fold hydrolase [Sphingomonas bacterium]|uniref:alpha/beta hydrolase n=1 Tax=Sphingomonas bacterium TaxID=1895847 RepID=UPI00262CE7F5|nr:alpha/beta fold hydrolase [Sphingomonas bacterium]MDB5704304.1 alpha/beta fold hydrolase [Sphingomonas bacterium]
MGGLSRKGRSALRFLPIAGLIAIAAGLIAAWAVGSALVRPTPSTVAPATRPALDFHLASKDGVTLGASYWPGARADGPAVLLLHGNGAARAAMAPTAMWLAAQGFAVLSIDFRGHGDSTAREHSFGHAESADAHVALRWLRHQQHGGKIAVIGVSLGGAAALIGPEGPVPADALVLQAVYPDIRHAIRNRIAAVAGAWPAFLLEPLLSYQSRPRFGVWPDALSPIAALPAYRGPVLIVGGGADRYTPPDETRALYAAARGPKRLWWATGMDHASVSGVATPAYRAALLAFLVRTIGAPKPS